MVSNNNKITKDNFLTIKSSDNKVVIIDNKILKYFSTLYSLENNINIKSNNITINDNQLFININSNVFDLVFNWIEIKEIEYNNSKNNNNNDDDSKTVFKSNINNITINEISRPYGDKLFTELIKNESEATFINNLNLESLINLINAAEILKINSLLDVCLCKLSTNLRDIDNNNLVNILGINIPSRDDLLNIYKGNSWIMKVNEDRLNELNN